MYRLWYFITNKDLGDVRELLTYSEYPLKSDNSFMPRKARIDAPGALHHIIVRGIEKRDIFRDDHDRDNFLERLGKTLIETATPCYAWALMPNHVHLLLRTGMVPIATVMRRLLTGYAQQFNRRHKRHGQLFQNRYKSILCEEGPYLLELVRYIHLNPIRMGVIENMNRLKKHQYTGHAVLMGANLHEWQDRDYILKLFGNEEGCARGSYEAFVADGIGKGRRPDLVGGGLIRSVGGWTVLKEYCLQGYRIKGDERILGSSDFVMGVLKRAEEEFEQSTLLKQQGIDLEDLMGKVARYFDVDIAELSAGSRRRSVVKAREVICCVAVKKLKMSCFEVSRKFNISPSAVSKSVSRGHTIVSQTNIEEKLLTSQ